MANNIILVAYFSFAGFVLASGAKGICGLAPSAGKRFNKINTHPDERGNDHGNKQRVFYG